VVHRVIEGCDRARERFARGDSHVDPANVLLGVRRRRRPGQDQDERQSEARDHS
jgi:hypothetical protein